MRRQNRCYEVFTLLNSALLLLLTLKCFETRSGSNCHRKLRPWNTNTEVDRQIGGWMDRWMDGWMDRWMDGWVDGWMDGWMDGWIDGWIDRQTDE